MTATLPGYMVNVEHSPDYKYVYYTTGGPEPMAFRIRLADRKVETIISLKSLPLPLVRAKIPSLALPGMARRYSPAISVTEIYALTVNWP